MAVGTGPVVTDDFFHGDVRGSLERVRKRLLDLSKRNRLLNFRYPKRGRSYLRVVDELPDQLCETLLDGKQLIFRPVPQPSKTELEAWRAERMQRLREQCAVDLEPEIDLRAEALVEPSAEEFARRLGIRTEYALPSPSPETQEELRHQDDLIQTLHFADDLERILNNIRAKANLEVQETGTNKLYLAFGFLTWYEADASDVRYSAPLFLLPVTVEKTQYDEQAGVYRYAVAYSGEDLVPNVSLQEKARVDFGLTIPDLEDGELPESYGKRVGVAVASRERWSVQRHVTLCLLSFGRLLMYLDLDPKRWPGGGLESHPKIRDFFIGVERGDVTRPADYEIDRIPDAPDLIYDADSSQHSALIDAVRGQDLVIEGPPGTGKSQTITNLIAAALSKGKTVLFVSEKLAALEVVQKRLTAAGLGVFCLELHSHKTQKNAFLHDLEERLRRRQGFPAPAELTEIRRTLLQRRDELNRYAELIGSTVGSLGKTIHEVLWAAGIRRRRLGADAQYLQDFEEPQATSIRHEDLSVEKSRLQGVTDVMELIRQQFGALDNHPWRGVSNPELTFLDRPRGVSSLGALREAGAAVDTTYATSERALRAYVSVIERVPDPPPGAWLELLEDARTGEARQTLLGFCDELDRIKALSTELGAVAPALAEEPDLWVSRLPAIVELGRALPGVQHVAGLIQGVEDLSKHVECVECCSRLLKALDASLPAIGGGSVGALHVTAALGEVLKWLPVASLPYRPPAGGDTAAIAVVGQLLSQQERLRSTQRTLLAELNLKSVSSPRELRADARTFASAGWTWWLIPAVWASRRRFKSVARQQRSRTNAEMAAVLRTAAEHLEARHAFERHPELARIAGRHLAGLDTPLAEISEQMRWQQALELKLRATGQAGATVLDDIRHLDSQVLEVLSMRLKDAPTESDLDASIRSIQAAMDTDISDDESAHEFLARARTVANRLEEISGWLRDLGLPDDYPHERLEGLEDKLRSLVGAKTTITARRAEASGLGLTMLPDEATVSAFRNTVQYAGRITEAGLPPDVAQELLSSECTATLERIRPQAAEVAQQLERFARASGEFAELTALDVSEWLDGGDGAFDGAEISAVIASCDRALSNQAAFDSWVGFLNARKALAYKSSVTIVTAALTGAIGADNLATGFEYVLYNALSRRAFSQHPELVRFQGMSHDRLQEEFRRLDIEVTEINRRALAAALDTRPVPWGNGMGPVSTYTELALIEHEVAKQKRHIPIRRLVSRAGRALQALKPCFMMGPLSVAQYVEPGQLSFDLVVMDEASQIKPEDALGAVARGGQLVVVGDPKQLPPTPYFNRLGEEDEEEDEDLAEGVLQAESILDVAASAYAPPRILRWHYRSRHPSLIAFSNREFYGEQLITFPNSVIDSPHLGVKFHPIRGRYEGRRNIPEAAAVLDFVFKHMRSRPDESLGVATLNAVQRDVIQEEFEQRLKNEPSAQAYQTRWEEGLEPFFIKNLENVQGDERDVIVLSVTFGPDPSGRLYQRFGSITWATGFRRLNVLVTRAKSRVEVFSSLHADDIRISESSSAGLLAFRNYLAYAETGVLEQARLTGREPDSDFEVDVAHALGQHGYQVHAQVGVAGYFLDLAVRHPRKPGRFILGIECDGASYHSAKSARDRDRLRQQVLEDMGWNIHRVWSTDWFRDPEREVDKIAARVEQMMEREPEEKELVTAIQEADVPSVEVGAQAAIMPEQEPAVLDQLATTEWLSEADAREELAALAQVLVETFGDVPPEQSILRPEHLEALLRTKPGTKEEWLRKIPLDLRLDTAPEHMVVLDDILSIVSRIA